MTSALPNVQIAKEAADWAIRLDTGPMDPAEREALARWLKTSPLHVGELLNSCALLGSIGRVSRDDTPSIEALLSHVPPDAIPLFPEETAAGAQRKGAHQVLRPSRVRSIGFKRAALAACVAGGLALSLMVAFAPEGEQAAPNARQAQAAGVYVTAVGEQRSIALEDGTVVSMNATSGLEVSFSAEVRRVDLLQGEAIFDVAHDTARPFRVYASGTLVQAVGTTFVVKHTMSGVRVVVLDGKVLLNTPIRSSGARATAPTPGAASQKAPRFLVAGQEVTVGTAEGPLSVTPADVLEATAWRDRQLAFTDEPLAAIALEFNRYNRKKLEVRGSRLAGTRFSGVFDADDPDSLIAFLELSAGVHVDRTQPGKVILEPKS